LRVRLAERGGRSLALPPTASLGPGLFDGPSAGGGLAIEPEAEVTLVDSAVTHNTADGLGLGGGIFNAGDLTLERTNVHRNVAGFAGGGVKNFGSLQADDSTFSENVATVAGGGISSAFGAGLQIDGSTINGNLSALWGGGLYYDGQGSELPPITASAHTTGADDAEGDAPDEITNTTFADNAVRFADGGAIFVASGSLALTNDTVADNMVFNQDLLSLLLGGGFLEIGGKAPWERGAGIFANADSEVSFQNTIVANSTDRGIEDNCDTDAEVGSTPFTSLGHNLDTGFSCGFHDPVADPDADDEGTDKENADPKLADLRDNGGPTQTMELLAGSQALEGGDNASCTNLDQRGGSRPLPAGSSGEKCDIGAYEANSLADLSVEGYSDAPDAVVAGSPLTYNAVVRNSGPDTIKGVKLADVLPAGATVDSAVTSAGTCSGGGPVDCSLGDLAKGDVVRVELFARPSAVGTAESAATVSAPGMTDTNGDNDSRSTSTTVVPAGQEPQPQQQQQQQQPGQQLEQDKDVQVNLTGPKTATIDQFMNGIVVEADCTDEECLRRFREHAAINTGASHIAGFNLTVSRGSLGLTSKRTKFRLRPCQSGSKNGRRHKRCMTNLRKAAKKAKKFKVKVVVSAVDAAGNKDYAKTFVTVGG
jgi:uncharacterized repeat protein (TIGR01451 family)